MIIDRDTKFIDYDFQSRNLADDATNVKADGMLTEKMKKGNIGTHHIITKAANCMLKIRSSIWWCCLKLFRLRQRLLLMTFKWEIPEYRCH